MNRININAVQIRSEIDHLARAALSSAFKSLFSDIEKKLFSRAEHTSDQEDKAAFFELIESLKTNQQHFEEQFFSSVSNRDLENNIPKSWLDLVHDRTLSLLIEDMIAHAKARYGMEHAQFESRIKLLSQSYPESIPERFYTLPAIVTAFLLNIRIFLKPLKKDIIRVLGNQVLVKLEPMYMLMNDHLVQLGVLPQIKSVRGTEFEELEDLFNTLFDRDGDLDSDIGAAMGQSENIAPLPILEDLLARKKLILRKAAHIQPDDFTDAFVAEVEKQIKNGKATGVVATKDKEVVRLVGAVIADIINDPHINPVIKKQVHILQTVLLHTAFDDPNFFSQINNPARTIVNELAVIGSDPGLDIDKISQIEALVSSIINEASVLSFSYVEALRSLYRIDGRSSKNSENALKAIQNRHPEVLTRCRNRITSIIRDKVQNTRMGAQAQAFIEEVWAPFMVQILMTHGRQCDEWHEANTVLDRIVDVEATPPVSTKQLIELDSHIKELLRHSQVAQGSSERPSSHEEYHRYLEKIWSAIPLPVHTPPPESEPPPESLKPAHDEPTPTTPTKRVDAPPISPTPDRTPSSPSAQTPVSISEARTNAPNDPAIRTELATGAQDDLEATRPIPHSKYHDAVGSPQAVEFFNRYVLGDEWFQVYTTEGAALRRLKVSSINFELGVVNFSNRNGELTLFLPLAQVFRDIVEHRTLPVFDNAQFNSAREKLIHELKIMDE